MCVHESLAPRASPDGIFWISGSVCSHPHSSVFGPRVSVYMRCISGWNRQNFNYCAKLPHTPLFSAIILQRNPTQIAYYYHCGRPKYKVPITGIK